MLREGARSQGGKSMCAGIESAKAGICPGKARKSAGNEHGRGGRYSRKHGAQQRMEFEFHPLGNPIDSRSAGR